MRSGRPGVSPLWPWAKALGIAATSEPGTPSMTQCVITADWIAFSLGSISIEDLRRRLPMTASRRRWLLLAEELDQLPVLLDPLEAEEVETAIGAERPDPFRHGRDRRIAPAHFDRDHHQAMHAHLVGQRLLRKPRELARRSQFSSFCRHASKLPHSQPTVKWRGNERWRNIDGD